MQACKTALLIALLSVGLPSIGTAHVVIDPTKLSDQESNGYSSPDPDSLADPDSTTYRAVASRASPGTPNVDGKLDDPEWAQAREYSNFVQRDPEEGELATERTVFRVLYDNNAVYFGIRAYDSEPDKIVGRLTRRDQYSESDWIHVSIDSYYDRRTAFEFRVNPAGVERDKYIFDDNRDDNSWNAVWDVATSVDEEGWVAEFRIPLSQLRFSAAPEQTWGFNVERIIQRKNETDQWKPIPKEGSGWVSEYGDLAGIQGISPPRRLEVLPYVASAQFLTPSEDGNPFQDGSEFMGSAGADLKYGVTNNMTLDLTINPDFGEVEADPSVVNLGVFETFFEERRPFFIEGSNIFQFSTRSHSGGSEKLFHSRRIGRSPRGDPDTDGFVDVPDKTSILGAAKLSGKTSSGWSLGFLDALTAEEKATVQELDGSRYRETVEPLTNHAVGRVQRDFREGKSAIGGMLTAVNRDVPQTMDFLHSAAYSGGIDARHRFWNGNWELTGKLLGSHVRGSADAIAETQQRSSRYFQRTDADHLTFDPTRTSLSGAAGAVRFGKIGGGHWRGNVSLEFVSPGFEINDLGFLRQADVIRNNAWIGYREFNPGKIFRRYNLNWNFYNSHTFGGERTNLGTNVNGSFTLLNYWGGWAGIERWVENINTRVLRGGPSMIGPGGYSAWYGFNSDNRKRVQVDAGGWFWWDDVRSDGGGVWAFASIRPVDNLRLTFGPEYSVSGDDWIYVTTGESSAGPHYVLSAIEQKTLSLTTRLDWTFTPNMGIQLYASPFISSGDYTNFREVVAPKADVYDDRFDAYGPDRLSFQPPSDPDTEWGEYLVDQDGDGTTDFSFGDPNFNFKQFNLNMVFRWEYMSGSTLFLVWSQNKTQVAPTGSFRPGSDFDALFGAPGENTFRFKVNYYLNP